MNLNWTEFIRMFGVEKDIPQQTTSKQEMNGEESSPQSKRITNADILDYVTAHFENEMNEKSFHNVVTFPMSFTIILNQKDYEGFSDYCRIVSKHIVLNFYRIIKEALAKGEDKVCEPLATYWNISFLQCEEEPLMVDGKIIKVEEGDYYICSCVHDKLTDQVNKNPAGSMISVSKGGSRLFANVNINQKSLEDLRIVGETHIQMDWDYRMSNVFDRHTPLAHYDKVAPGRLLTGGHVFYMNGGTYRVSGSEETSNDNNVFIVDSAFVENGHIQVEYISKEDKFKMAAFAPTKLNGKQVPLSDANDKQWLDLSDGDSINLADDIILTFRKSTN